MHFVGLYRVITLQRMVLKHKNIFAVAVTLQCSK